MWRTHWLRRPLPFPDADRIVAVHVDVAGGRGKLVLREFREPERDTRTLAKWGTSCRTQ